MDVDYQPRSESFLEKQLELCLEIFEEKLYPTKDGLMYMISVIMEDGDEKVLNCIGDNLEDCTHNISMFLMNDHRHSDVSMATTTYFLLMYLVVERIETVFNLIGLKESYRLKNYKSLHRIKKWANFLKHPKAFFLCHSPTWILSNDQDLDEHTIENSIVIDDSFIFKYYSGDKNNKELFKRLANKMGVLVQVPDLPKITEAFCLDLVRFVELIRNNEVFRELLSEASTAEDYFEEE